MQIAGKTHLEIVKYLLTMIASNNINIKNNKQ
jgi:hypothetical protein